MIDTSFRRRQGEPEEESYFISMSDMLVGLLFVFIILLVYFAVTFKQKEDYLVGAGEARRRLLEQLEKDIEQKLPGVDISINTETGILTWELKLAQNETKKIRISYKVKYPKDKIIDNL